MDIVLFALAGAFSFAIIKYKLTHGMKADAILDGFMMVIIMYFFAGTATGGAVAMTMSAMISIYLFFDPLKLVMPKFLEIERTTITKINYTLLTMLLIALIITGFLYAI